MEEDIITLMCPKCGNYTSTERDKHDFDICDFCGEKRIKIDVDFEVIDNCPSDFYKCRAFEDKIMYRKFLYNNPKFDEEIFQKRIGEEEQEYLEYENKYAYLREKSYADNNPRCPKCGSTAIQAVPRKWGLFAGIFTNKVDRVCLNCKHKF